MDMQALLIRMDQLEKLVISQSRELDNLKRIVRNASLYKQLNTPDRIQQQPVNYSSNALNNQDSRRPNQDPNSTENLLSSPPLSLSCPKSPQVPLLQTTSRPLYQPLMNSNVHPQSAIPPIGIRTTVSTTDITTTMAQNPLAPSQDSLRLVERLGGFYKDQQVNRCSLGANNTETNQRVQNQYLTQTPNGFGAIGEANKDAFDENDKKHERQNFFESFLDYQSRFRELQTKNDQNCENKSPRDLRQIEDQCQVTRQDTQQVLSNQPESNFELVLEKQCTTDTTSASSTTRTRLRAKESIFSPDDDLTQYIVGELEFIPEDTPVVKEKFVEEEKHIYITFIAPYNKGQLWRRIRENSISQSPRKRKHNDQEAREKIVLRQDKEQSLSSGRTVIPQRRDWTSIYHNISKKYRHQ